MILTAHMRFADFYSSQPFISESASVNGCFEGSMARAQSSMRRSNGV
jgi:hypothetical protein